MSLTEEEKVAGRGFRDEARDAWLYLPETDVVVPWTLNGYRHECAGAGKGKLASAAAVRAAGARLAVQRGRHGAQGAVLVRVAGGEVRRVRA
jgi:hypothetical protein